MYSKPTLRFVIEMYLSIADNKAFNYRVKIYKNLENINKMPLTRIEAQKLKQLNDLFLVLLTEESNMKKEDNSNNIEEDEDDILIVNGNLIKERKKTSNEIKKNRNYINLVSN